MRVQSKDVIWNPKTDEYEVNLPVDFYGTLFGVSMYFEKTDNETRKAIENYFYLRHKI